MAMTLYIINDDETKKLGSAVTDAMLAEVKEAFAFLPTFEISMILADSFPAVMDFTDAVVKIIPNEDDVKDRMVQMEKAQSRSIVAFVTNMGIRVTLAPLVVQDVDGGGVGWNLKVILTVSNGVKIAVTQSGGVISIDFVADTTLTQFAPNSETLDEAQKRRDVDLAKARTDNNPEKKKQALTQFEAAKKFWSLKSSPPQDWPKDLQNKFAIGLGRALAHEARHQFITDHSAKGLGQEAAPFYEESASRFSEDDRKEIAGTIHRLETLQRTARVTAESFSPGQPSGLK